MDIERLDALRHELLLSERLEVQGYIETQQREIAKLKADLLEMAEAYCYGSTNVSLRLKAEQIIESK